MREPFSSPSPFCLGLDLFPRTNSITEATLKDGGPHLPRQNLLSHGKTCKRFRFAQRYSLNEFFFLSFVIMLIHRDYRNQIFATLSLENDVMITPNGVMITPKRRLSTLIFACLCFKKSILIKIAQKSN